MAKLRWETFQKIKTELRFHHDNLREMESIRQDIIYAVGQTDENIGGSRSSLPADPTAQKGSTLEQHTRLKQLERYVMAIHRVYEFIDDDKKKLIHLRYWARPQILNWEGVALQLHISPRTARNWNTQIIRSIASELGER